MYTYVILFPFIYHISKLKFTFTFVKLYGISTLKSFVLHLPIIHKIWETNKCFWLNSFEKVQFGSLVMISSLSLLVEVCETEEVVDLLWPFLSSWRRGFRTALVKIILHQPVKESRLRLSRVECFARRKKEKEGKRKKKEREKMKTFARPWLREQAETGGSMKHPQCTFIGSHEQIYSCDAIPSYSRA